MKKLFLLSFLLAFSFCVFGQQPIEVIGGKDIDPIVRQRLIAKYSKPMKSIRLKSDGDDVYETKRWNLFYEDYDTGESLDDDGQSEAILVFKGGNNTIEYTWFIPDQDYVEGYVLTKIIEDIPRLDYFPASQVLVVYFNEAQQATKMQFLPMENKETMGAFLHNTTNMKYWTAYLLIKKK